MARVKAPPSARYTDRDARIAALRAKERWTPQETSEILRLLLDDYMDRKATPQP